MTRLGTSPLGTSKLGRPTAPTELPEPEEDPRDRADRVMKNPYPTDPGTVWDKFLNTITDEPEQLYASIREVERHRDVDTATGGPLEKIGGLFTLPRRQGESDAHYRKRIKLQLPIHTTSATLDEIIDDSTMLLDCAPSEIRLYETFDIEPARFDVFIDERVVTEANVTVPEYVQLMRDVKAAGVRVVATIGKQFTYRSEYEFLNGLNDPERGYGSLDDSMLGGPYADRITAMYGD